MENLELFSSRVCPFAHRTRLALGEKGFPFTLTDIDLQNKPHWYLEINPNGTVPMLRHGNFVLRESLVINEYINELAETPPLLPKYIQKRAEARFWIALADSQFIPLFYQLLRGKNQKQGQSLGKQLQAILDTFNKILAKNAVGPYWFGSQMTLTDITIYPWFERWPVLEYYRGQTIPRDLTALVDWIEAMQARKIVRKESESAEYYIAAYVNYAKS